MSIILDESIILHHYNRRPMEMNRYVIIGGDSLSDGCTSHQCRKKIKPPEKKNQLPDKKNSIL